jgi:hypothetical protein
MNLLANLVTMSFPYATETVCLAMAIQGSMTVRQGPNKSRSMHWFHAFVRSTLTAYAGATFTNIFMGRPTAMLSNDVFFGACLLGYLLVNYTPFNLAYLVFNSPPGQLVVTVLSQVFRVGGIKGFSDAAFAMFKENPSPYYDVPVFGPILFPSVLGNMGGFFFCGLDGYLEKGMPWLFQQGISCSTFYHFYAHDTTGFIGTTLRTYLRPIAVPFMTFMGASDEESNDDALFAHVAVGCFMVLMAVLRMDMVLGGKFSPFEVLGGMICKPFGKKRKDNVKKPKKKKVQ